MKLLSIQNTLFAIILAVLLTACATPATLTPQPQVAG
jgi:hypothetical protein